MQEIWRKAKAKQRKKAKESEMYNLGVMHGQQKMREKMLNHLDHLVEEIRKNDY